MSVRRAVVRPGEIGDLMPEVLRYEESMLPDHHKAALRYTDAFLSNPTGLDEEARAALRAHLSDVQIVELTFKLLYWSCNKALIALGIDGPVDPEKLTDFHYDERGAFVLHTSGT